MRYCERCVQPDTRPGLVFKGDVCMACIFAGQKVDWNRRRQELDAILTQVKEKSKSTYDCVIGVSGGKDSYVQALYARDKLNLKVLLVNGVPDKITDVGRANLENLVQQGFDLVMLRPDPTIMRKLVKYAFYEYGNPVKPTEYPLYASAWQVAEKFNIPLVIQGENPGITLGITGFLNPTGDATEIFKHNTLITGIQEQTGGLVDADALNLYQLPETERLIEKSILSVYLGYYMEEWSYSNNINFARSYGLRGRSDHDPVKTGRLSPYCSIDSDMQIVNQMLKYLKFGFGFVTDEVGYYIREGNMTRKEGVGLVKKYDGKCAPYYINEFCKYIGISVDKFWQVVGGFVNKNLFYREDNMWKPKFVVGKDF